jgi:hypothetical protein
VSILERLLNSSGSGIAVDDYAKSATIRSAKDYIGELSTSLAVVSGFESLLMVAPVTHNKSLHTVIQLSVPLLGDIKITYLNGELTPLCAEIIKGGDK